MWKILLAISAMPRLQTLEYRVRWLMGALESTRWNPALEGQFLTSRELGRRLGAQLFSSLREREVVNGMEAKTVNGMEEFGA